MLASATAGGGAARLRCVARGARHHAVHDVQVVADGVARWLHLDVARHHARPGPLDGVESVLHDTTVSLEFELEAGTIVFAVRERVEEM